jgi:hypothetical protein
LGTEFLVPAIGDTTTPPLTFPTSAEREGRVESRGLDPRITTLIDTGQLGQSVGEGEPIQFEGSGKGLINVMFSFIEEQAKTFNPGNILDEIVFDIFPNEELTGPVFVSTEIVPPDDLNVEEGDFPVDDDQPTGSIEPEVVTITETVEVPVEIPVPTPAFVAGANGITNEGVSFAAGDTVPGPPPTGWTTEADGRAYPPIILPTECDPTGLDGKDGEDLTPLQQLVKDVEGIPSSFGSATQRRGFVVDADGQLTGNSPGRVSRRTVEHVVADSLPGQQQFKIVGRSRTFIDGTSIFEGPFGPSAETNDYFDTVNLMVSVVKEGQLAPFSAFRPSTFKTHSLSRTIKTAFDNNDDLIVPRLLSSAELQSFRIAATSLGLLRELQKNGPGSNE